MRRLREGLAVLALLVLVPAAAFAQASITGVVKDASGAILPGVTVEASSPALIEKTRSAITDGSGQYRIVDLRAGVYSVTFTLTGFSSVKRDGIELTGSFTAAINADMKVGAIEETITVSGETPIVDTQSVRRQVTVSNDVIASMPAARSYAGVMMLIPATTTQAGANLDIQVTPGMLVFGGAGGRTNEARIQVDGLNTGAAFNGAGVSSYVVDIGNAQEISMTTSGGLGEAEVGGPSFSIVPKTGGNPGQGLVLPVQRDQGHGRRQLHAGAQDRRPDNAGQALQALGHQRRCRRPDQEGRGLVFLPVPRRGEPPHGARYVRQREHGRSHEVDLRQGHHAPGRRRRQLAQRVDPHDGAADGPQQVQHFLGSADAVSGRGGPRLGGRLPAVGSRRDHLRCGRCLQSSVLGDDRP